MNVAVAVKIAVNFLVPRGPSEGVIGQPLKSPRPEYCPCAPTTVILLIYYVSRYIVNGSGIVAVIGIRDLANNTSAVVEQVARTGRPTLVTRRGHPVAALIAVDEDELLDHILANAPEYVRSVSLAQAEVAKGQRGRLLGEVVAELDSEA